MSSISTGRFTTLAKVLAASSGALPEPEARAWLLPVVRALATLHAGGRAHLGVRADAVLRDGPDVRLSEAGDGHEGRSLLERQDGFVPEAVHGCLGAPSDVYMWGVLAHEVLTGKPLAQAAEHPVYRDPGAAATALAHLPRPWGEILAGCLVWSPLQRWSAAAVASAIAPDAPPAEPAVAFTMGELPAGHAGAICGLAVSPDGEEAASIGEDGTLRRWRLGSGQPVLIGVFRWAGATHVTYHPSGALLVVGPEGHVSSWGGAWGPGRRDWAPIAGAPLACGGAEPWLLARCEPDAAWRLIDLPGAERVRTLPWPAGDKTVSQAVSADGQVLACAIHEGGIHVLDARDGRTLCAITRNLGGWQRLALSSDGALIACEDESAAVRVMRAADGASVAYIQDFGSFCRGRVPNRRIETLAFSPDGRHLVIQRRTDCGVYRVADGTCVEFPELGHVSALAITPDGTTLLAGCRDGALQTWRLPGTASPVVREAMDAGVSAFAFSADGTRVVTAGKHGVQVWSGPDGRLLATLARQAPKAYKLAISPDGRTLALPGPGSGHTIELWSLTTYERLASYEGLVDFFAWLTFSPDGTLLAVSNLEGTVAVRRVSDGAVVWHRHVPDTFLYRLVFTPDGRSLYVGTLRESYAIWRLDLETGTVVEILDLPNERTLAPGALDPDGLPSRAEDAARAWSQWNRIYVPAAVSADGTLIAVGDTKGHVFMWDRTAGRLRINQDPWWDVFEGAAFSPDGAWLVWTADKDIILYPLTSDAGRGWYDFNADIVGVGFSPDSQVLWVGTRDGRCWHKDPATYRDVRTHDMGPFSQPWPQPGPHPVLFFLAQPEFALVEGPSLSLAPPPAPDTPEVHLSVDGTWLAWQAAGVLYRRPLSGGSAVSSHALPPGAVVFALGAGGRCCLYREGRLVRMVEFDSGRCLKLGAPTAAAFTVDGRELLVVKGKKLRCVNLETGASPCTIADDPRIADLRKGTRWSPDAMVRVSVRRRRIVAWNTADTELFTVQAVGDASLAAAWHGEALVVVAREPGSATVSHWRLNPAEAPRTDGESPCVGLAWQEEGRSLVSLHRDRRVVVRSAVDGGEQASWQLRPTAPRCLPALDPSGRWVAYGTALDNRLALFDVHAGRHAGELPVAQIRLNGNRPWWLAFSADGTYLAVSYTTTENCPAAACWRVADGALLCAWTYSPLTWTVLAVSPDGTAIAKGARSSENGPVVAIVEVQKGGVTCLSPQGSEVSALAYAATGAHLASGDEAGLVACWRCGDWTQAWTGQLPAAVVHVAFTPDGSWLWAQGADGTVRAWRTSDGEEVASVLMPLGGGAGATGFAVSDKAVAVALDPCGVLLQPVGLAAPGQGPSGARP